FIFYEINISVFEEVMLWFSQFMEKGEKDNEKSDK
ncbi:transcriptional regulator, partial [Clostridioides difficile]|nr:transcriptional regulator [Clostridioides difficile]